MKNYVAAAGVFSRTFARAEMTGTAKTLHLHIVCEFTFFFFFVWRNFNFFCAHLFFLGAFSCLAGVMFAGVSARFARCAPLAAIMRHFRFIRAFKFFSLG